MRIRSMRLARAYSPGNPLMKTRSALALAAAVIATIAVYLACRPGPTPEPPRTFEQLLTRAEALGLTVVPSPTNGPNVIWLVRDPATFVEDMNLYRYPRGVVRVQRGFPGSVAVDGEWQAAWGNCDLLGDQDLIHQLLADR